MKKKRLMTNLIANLLAFAIQMAISFILSPYLVNRLGNEAYGFIGLANNFVSYVTILTVALNSMAGRFISLEINKENYKKANEYYASTFFANLFMSIIVAVLSSIMIFNLNNLINVSAQLDTDVKITFILVFLNFIISILTTVFSVATFIRNRIDIDSIKSIFLNLLRVSILLVLFAIFQPKIYYIAIASVVCTILGSIINIFITRKLVPELKIKIRYFNFESIKTLLLSGIWNSINSLARVLLTGLDLLVANLFVSGEAMGILSIAKTVPNMVESLLSTIAGVFTPQFTILYAQGKKEELISEIKFSIKLLSLIMTVPLAGLVIFGYDFYSLWLPVKSADEIMQIQILSIISVLPYIFSAYIFTLFSIDTVTNQLKRPVIASFIMSIVTIITEIIVLRYTNLGVYAIAGVSSFYWLIKIWFFNPINAAYNLKIKWNTFYPPFLKASMCLILILVAFSIGHSLVSINSWVDFLFFVGIFGIIGYIINFIILLNKNEKTQVVNKIKSKIIKIPK